VDIAAWLRELGLERSEMAFRENDIAPAIVLELTEQDLKELGVSLGHRRLLLKAISGPGQRAGRSQLGLKSRMLRRLGPHLTRRTPSADGPVLRSGRLD
jgi:hypothetical protein